MSEQAQYALFIEDTKQRSPRAVQDVMVHPFFSLSKRPRFTTIEWESRDGNIKHIISANVRHGIASIYDADFLWWACGQIRLRAERTGVKSPTLAFVPHKMFKQMGKKYVGRENYAQLRRTMQRLKTTSIETTVRTEHQQKEGGFSWIDEWGTDEDVSTGTPSGMWSVTVSNWLYQAIMDERLILSLSAEYFQLKSGLEKKLYQIARKCTGYGSGAEFPMETLHRLTASEDQLKFFANDVRNMQKKQRPLLEYVVQVFREVDGPEIVKFTPRDQLPKSHPLYQPESVKAAVMRAANRLGD